MSTDTHVHFSNTCHFVDILCNHFLAKNTFCQKVLFLWTFLKCLQVTKLEIGSEKGDFSFCSNKEKGSRDKTFVSFPQTAAGWGQNITQTTNNFCIGMSCQCGSCHAALGIPQNVGAIGASLPVALQTNQ